MLVVPTAPTAHTIAAVQADPIARNRELGYYTNFVNLLDLSAIAVPASIRADGLPFGITLIGPAGSELRLADLAQRFHQQTGLTLGATGEALPAATPIPRVPGSTVKVAVVGAHLAGLPLNSQLLERGARLVATVKTAPHYRFYALAGTVPPKPGLLRVAQDGAAIEAEIWEMPMSAYGSFVCRHSRPAGHRQHRTGRRLARAGIPVRSLALRVPRTSASSGAGVPIWAGQQAPHKDCVAAAARNAVPVRAVSAA